MPIKRFVCMVRRVRAPPSKATKGCRCILQNFGVMYRISDTVKPVIMSEHVLDISVQVGSQDSEVLL